MASSDLHRLMPTLGLAHQPAVACLSAPIKVNPVFVARTSIPAALTATLRTRSIDRARRQPLVLLFIAST
jgi:hypothetical protein